MALGWRPGARRDDGRLPRGCAGLIHRILAAAAAFLAGIAAAQAEPIPSPFAAPLGPLDRFEREALMATTPEPSDDGAVALVPLDRAPEVRQGLRGVDRDRPVLRLERGIVDLERLAGLVGDATLLERIADGYVLHLPLLVGPGASLIVRGTTLRLSTPGSAVLVAAGRLYLVDATVTSLDPATGEPTRLEDDDAFRPFVLGTGGSEIRIAGSRLASLGHRGEKAYGLTVSAGPGVVGDLPPPRLWMVDSRVEDLFYGLYTFEAADVVVVDSRFSDNIVYGIDPHDFTRGLVVARNVVERTRRRHGIVLARGVRDAWILDNVSRGNGGSGLLVDDRGTDVVIAGNELVGNDWDGIALFESDDVAIRDNRIVGNGRDGLRVRNSTGVVAEANVIADNGSDGVEVYGSRRPDGGGSHALLCRNLITTPGDAAVDVHGTARLDWLRGTGEQAVPLAQLKLRDRASLEPWLADPPDAMTVTAVDDGTVTVRPADASDFATWCGRKDAASGRWTRLPRDLP